MQPNALALEYQGIYGTARGNLNVFDLVNNPVANGKCRVLNLSFPEEFPHGFFPDVGSFRDDRAHPFLIAQN
jgi:hypothetical protein